MLPHNNPTRNPLACSFSFVKTAKLLIGLLMVTNKMIWISIWAQQNGFFIDLPFGRSAEPTYIIAILAGLLTFLSPCVLPLVPAYVGYLSGKVIDRATLPVN